MIETTSVSGYILCCECGCERAKGSSSQKLIVRIQESRGRVAAMLARISSQVSHCQRASIPHNPSGDLLRLYMCQPQDTLEPPIFPESLVSSEDLTATGEFNRKNEWL